METPEQVSIWKKWPAASTVKIRTPRSMSWPTTPRTTRNVALGLIGASNWFMVTPHPDGEWVITIKEGDESVLDKLPHTGGLAVYTNHEIEL